MPNDLTELNALRVQAGKPELKAWKESKIKLVETIARTRNEVAMMKARASKEAAAPTPAPAPVKGDRKTFTAVEVAKELGMNDRVIRQKLRRIYRGREEVKGLPPLINEEWEWVMKHKSAVIDLLKRDRRAKS